MATVLYLKGNPKSVEQSNTFKISETFVEHYKQTNPGDKIETLDLYEDNIPLLDAHVFSGWGKLAAEQELQGEEKQKVDRLNELVEQFMAADKVILAAPMWNFGYPPMVKAYFDAVAVAGKTFKYTDQGPVGLVGDKKVVAIETRGGMYQEEPGAQQQHTVSHSKTFFGLLGIETVEHILAEGLNYNPDAVDELVAKAKEDAKQLATSF